MTRTDRRCPRSTAVPAGTELPRRRLADFDESDFAAYLQRLLQDAERHRESQQARALTLLEVDR